MTKKQPAGPFVVVAGTSTRASLDPKDPGFEQWVDFHPGDVATAWPEHAPVAEWVASGHWKRQSKTKEATE